MGKYLFVLINSIKRNLAYRVNVMITIVSVILTFVVMFYFWTSIYSEGNQIGNYTLIQLLTYYVFVTVFQLYFTGDNAAWSVGEEIKRGQININILKPINYLHFKMAQSFGGLVFRIIIFTPVILLLLWIMRDYIQGPSSFISYLLYFTLSVFSYLLYFLIYYTLGVLGFWFTETSSLFFAWYVVIGFMQGTMIPLDLLPQWLISISNMLPFKYLFFVPVSFISGRAQFEYSMILVPLFWCALLYLVAIVTYKKGIKKYEGFGI